MQGERESDAVDAARETLELVHHHPGRLRLRATVFRGLSAQAEAACAEARAMPGVSSVEHRAGTGSLLIVYEPGVAEPDAVVEAVARVAGLRHQGAGVSRRPPALLAVGAVQELNAVTAELLGHRADLRSLVPLGLAALGAYSFAKSSEQRLPRWDNLLWWSYSIFLTHHRAEIEASSEARAHALPAHVAGARPAHDP